MLGSTPVLEISTSLKADRCGVTPSRTARFGNEVRSLGDALQRELGQLAPLMQDYRNLKVWEKAHAFALEVHLVCDALPRHSGAALGQQLRRAALSVPANIAEGTTRGTDVEFRRFLYIALGSATECDYHLLVAKDTRLLNEEDYESLRAKVVEIRRMLTGLIKRITASIETNANEPRRSLPKSRV